MMAAKRPLSKREQEELKKKEDLQRSAEVFSEFLETFEQTETLSAKKFTAFVRGGVVKPGSGEEHHAGDPSERLYMPKPTVAAPVKPAPAKTSRFGPPPSAAPVIPQPAVVSSKPVLVKKEKEKKKSNLEMFKEELKAIQEEREERKRLKEQISKIESKIGITPVLPPSSSLIDDDHRVFDGTYDLSGEAGSTNLYMGNLAPNITEEQLCQVFGRYGPIASVKIMYPRGEEKEEYHGPGRNTLCGFVAFMCRIDAERAMANLRGRDVMGYEMRLGWGKSVNIPPFPKYVPPRLKELLEPPAFSGFPFNAQPSKEDSASLPEDLNELSEEEFNRVFSRCTVRVCQPQDRSVLLTIHRVVEFVVREGPIFEAMLMQREKENPLYRFLFDNRCNEHVYYRWKLFSILQGDTPTQWKTKEFYMFENGPIFKPPPISVYTNGMPEELIREEPVCPFVKDRDSRGARRDSLPKESTSTKGLSEEAQADLKKIVSDLTASRDNVADAMVFCIDHSDAAEEIIAAICDSLTNDDPPMKKLAKIYLMSDILHNCSSVHVQNAWYYRNGFEQRLPFIFTQIRNSHKSFEGRLKAEHYKQKVMNCFRAWEDWALYPPKYLIRLQNVFLGLEPGEEAEEPLDGKPMESPLAVLTSTKPVDDDLDGQPIDEDLDGAPLEDSDAAGSSSTAPVGFAPSRWETVDPEAVKAQAVTTSKWDLIDEQQQKSKSSGDSRSSKSIDEHVRDQLREIEKRVTKYQDELETGKRARQSGESVASQVAKYRSHLMSNSSGSSRSGERERKRSRSRSRERERNRGRDHSRERDRGREHPTKRARSRSRSSSRDRSDRHSSGRHSASRSHGDSHRSSRDRRH